MSIEKNKFYHESCMTTMGKMEDGEVDIVVTSPPYNIGSSRHRGRQYQDYDDNLPLQEYFDTTREWITEALRVTKHHVFWNVGEYNGNKGIARFLMNEFADYHKETWIWAKTNPPHAGGFVPARGYEYIFCFSHNRPEMRSFEENANFQNRRGPNGESSAYLRNVLIHGVNSGQGNRVKGLDGTSLHGFAFPEWLPEYFISHFTKPGDTVYDPFMGTGTTAVSAVKWGRNFIGSDLTEDYIVHACNRVAQRKIDLENEPFVVPEHFLENYE